MIPDDIYTNIILIHMIYYHIVVYAVQFVGTWVTIKVLGH